MILQLVNVGPRLAGWTVCPPGSPQSIDFILADYCSIMNILLTDRERERDDVPAICFELCCANRKYQSEVVTSSSIE